MTGGVLIDGVVTGVDNDDPNDAFLQEFIAFLEQRGWQFSGATRLGNVDEEYD